MRKRLTKKLRLREFTELGFELSYTLRPSISADEADSFLDRFLASAIEENHLSCGGGGQGQHWSFCVTVAGRGSASPEQRSAVGKWLADQPAIVSYELGEFLDMWHGPDESPPARRAQEGHA
jgi:uncharacterized protein YggL (DUF469 family)